MERKDFLKDFWKVSRGTPERSFKGFSEEFSNKFPGAFFFRNTKFLKEYLDKFLKFFPAEFFEDLWRNF